MLGQDFRPLYAMGPAEPRPPRWPQRVQHFMYACGKAAAIIEGKMKDTRRSAPPRRPSRAPTAADGRKGIYLPDGTFVSAEPGGEDA
jgi:hypothetical protein